MVSDFLVIGAGLAGLSFALKVADKASVILVCKSTLDETNTAYAQGGIASVMYHPDNIEKHVQDTLICGAGLCDEKIVRMIVGSAAGQIAQLIRWGVNFDHTPDGAYDLHKEGGHSEYRILHHKDNTGKEIQRALTDKVRQHPNITILEQYFAVDLLTQHHLGQTVRRRDGNIECYGAYILNLKTQQVVTFLAKATVVATGGLGNLYHTTTNPSIATGDGVAMIYRAKGVIENMEFIQFHPTALYHPGERPAFLITEALRGFGAILRTQDGRELMTKYDERGSLAPRDIVARAIDNEMKLRGDDFIYLDCTHKPVDEITAHFPTIYQKCRHIGIDITKDYIPVVPAAHYSCGGVKVDTHGCTSIRRLYALGETSCTGLHGANRLASNSLIEAVVYADNAARHALQHISHYTICDRIHEWDSGGATHTEEMVLITQNYKEMQQIMSNYVGIVRSNLRLKRALDRLEIIFKETEDLYRKSILTKSLCELRNMIKVSYLIIRSAQEMRESRGLHYSIDYPDPARSALYED
ncbi:MAG: L-aspartate oxidase [Prevotellaceae bacterium]|jgi:L-aspartate oxidase|nr:L-aspartate oxidase [Prevotellaceae bacterium]